MPAYESIHEYYLHQHRNIENYLALCMVHAETELVHELRLSIKKLRAFHKLAEELCETEMEEHIHIKNRVRRLFRIAGQLRDTQVQIHMLVSVQELTGVEYPEFLTWLLKREKKRISRFGSKPLQVIPQATTDTVLQKIGNWLEQANDETIKAGAGNVLTAMYSRVKKLAAGKMNPKVLHLIRTITKQIKYILNVMHHCYPDFSFSYISVDTLHNSETSVGQWHDKLVRVELLEKFMAKSNFEDDKLLRVRYQVFLKACKSELNIAYKDAYRIVRQGLNFKEK
jgi:CHAD domain-containing protein